MINGFIALRQPCLSRRPSYRTKTGGVSTHPLATLLSFKRSLTVVLCTMRQLSSSILSSRLGPEFGLRYIESSCCFQTIRLSICLPQSQTEALQSDGRAMIPTQLLMNHMNCAACSSPNHEDRSSSNHGDKYQQLLDA